MKRNELQDRAEFHGTVVTSKTKSQGLKGQESSQEAIKRGCKYEVYPTAFHASTKPYGYIGM